MIVGGVEPTGLHPIVVLLRNDGRSRRRSVRRAS
jgi:hypothetical protein